VRTTAGSGGTPLAKKLGIGAGSTVAVVGAPAGVAGGALEGLAGLVGDVTLKQTARGKADVVVAFFTDRGAFERRVAALAQMVYLAGGLWVAWPKRASGLATTVDEHVVREVALPLGLVDNKVCAIDETWSGLRVVWRKERRG